MYLKTLTIRGFKSFASKTTFEFEPGITSVIGPNGSGKSNVVDALAWVMGEQGVKNLRGGKMEDVIFAGTTGRAPLGRAQVELTIDNSDGTLPIEYSEVTISRTLFRSGGSEYQINGETARLLDIQELLSDSGLGREMHVIVGQGQLDRILQATPEERRGFIEEAAGILKHRRRKERSERKLESMRANLDRIRDLTDEVKRQLGPLSKQADTARRAQRIQHDVHDASARLLADDVVTQTARLQELRDTDKDLEQQQKKLVAKLDQAEIVGKKLSEQSSQTTQAAASARDHRYQLAALAERFRSLHALTNERLKTASRPAVASSGLSPEEASQQLVDSEQAHGESQDKLALLERELQDAQRRREAAERNARVAQETYAQLVREEADQEKSLAQAEGNRNAAETKLSALQTELQRLDQEADYSADSFQEFQQEIQQQQTALTSAEAELEESRQAKESVQEQAQEARSQLAKAEADANALRNKISAAEARVEVLQQALQPDPGSAQAALAEFDHLDISEILEIEPGWEAAISALLAGSTDRLWLEDSADISSVIQTLEKLDVSDVRVFHPHTAELSKGLQELPLAVSAMSVVMPREPHSAAFKYLQGILATGLLVDSVAEAWKVLEETAVANEYPSVVIATKQGHIVTPQWFEMRGSGNTNTLERRAEYERALSEVNRLKAELKSADTVRDQMTKVHHEARQKVKQTESQLQNLQSRVTTLRERLTVQQRNLDQQTAAQRRSADRRAKLQTDIEQAQESFHKAQERFDALRAATELVDDQAQGVEQAAEAQRSAEEEASAARAAETDARLALRSAENTTQQAAQRVEQARRRLSSAKIAQQEYQRALVRQRRTVERLTSLSAGIDIAIARIEKSIERAEHDARALEQQRDELQASVEASENDINTARGDLAKVQEQLQERRLVRQEHEIKLEQLQERSLKELGYSHQYLTKNFGPDQPVDTGEDDPDDVVVYDRSEQEKRLRTAKRSLSALGKINPLALEEYKAVQERYEYLTQQLADLEESRSNLLKIIEDVNATVLEVFTSAFEDTAAQFQHVFATLFPGGEGKLTLTEPDNMLETGIEVEARPAGKKVKRLSLLSGGERSLAAIALLVSIFKARPSPFYVMDEVEAALDDTNLTRLLTIFKELQHDSQLIIITHQKRTMEISDALYGVSMRGDGVSQVISQKLDHV
jgi:chromosome segregation protein